MKLGQRLKHAWNAFTGREQEIIQRQDIGVSNFTRPDRIRYHFGSERTILASIYTRIAIDVSRIQIRHVKMDDEDRYLSTINSGLNYCLNTEANIDQTSQAFKQDLVMSMLDEGVVAAVPVETTVNPRITGSYDIKSLRTGKIIEWYPQHVKINLYNDRKGLKEDIILPKSQVAIIENPLYAVMNEPISTLRRLIYNLNLMDSLDEKNSSSKLDLIIQLPYDVRTEVKRQEAEKRRRDIESQLTDNKYGIAYASSTEKITQLNRTVENKLMDEIEYLTSMLYSQLGMTKEVFLGNADERVQLNYINRTIEPIVSAISDEFNRKFLTKTARSQKQRVMYFNSIFKLGTIDSLANAGATLVTSEIATRNEVRQFFGFKPAEDELADQLTNPNINPRQEMGMAPEQGMYEEDAQPDVEAPVSIGDMRVSDIM
ncbi:MAG: phage portal protein [Clostridia bacterium]|nr:phage portal protein [Clostridia bacterium]